MLDPSTIYLMAKGAQTGGQILGSIFGNNANEDAMRDARRSAREQLQFQKDMWNQQVANMSPFIQTGQRGATEQEAAIRSFTQPKYDYVQKDFGLDNWQDPGYAFRLAEADKAINASTASKGMTLGSGALKALQKRNQDMASQEYANSFDRFMKDSLMRQTQAENAYNRDYTFGQGKINNWGNVADRGVQAGGVLAGAAPQFTKLGTDTMQNQTDATQGYRLNQGANTQKLWNSLGGGFGEMITKYGSNLPTEST